MHMHWNKFKAFFFLLTGVSAIMAFHNIQACTLYGHVWIKNYTSTELTVKYDSCTSPADCSASVLVIPAKRRRQVCWSDLSAAAKTGTESFISKDIMIAKSGTESKLICYARYNRGKNIMGVMWVSGQLSCKSTNGILKAKASCADKATQDCYLDVRE